MTALFSFNIVLAVFWAAVTGEFSAINLIFGFVLGSLCLFIIREQVGGTGYLRRVRRVLALVFLFIYELVHSAWLVAVLVMSPKMKLNPGIIAFPLSITEDRQIALLANLITLTPGTLSVDVSEDRRFIYVHAINAPDPEALKRDIAEGFETKIREAFE